MFSLLFNLLSFAISFAFPLVTTFKTLKTNDIELLKPWCIYWLVYSGLTLLEFQFYNVLLKFIPFYSICKLYLSIWLILPNTQGANFIYYHYVQPQLVKYESDFDQAVSKVYSKHPLETFGSLLKATKLFNGFSSSSTTPTTPSSTSPELATNNANTIFESLAKSYRSYYDSQAGSDPNILSHKNEPNILESLTGVLSYLPLGSTTTSSTTSSSSREVDSNGSTISKVNNTSITSNDDYDLVGKDDYENAVPESAPEIVEQKGWFSWWSGSPQQPKSKAD